MSSDTTNVSELLRVRDPRDSEAWHGFVNKYRPMIFEWCRSVGIQSADADDLAQSILMRLVIRMQLFRYDPAKSFRGWLRVVTQNAVRDHYRVLTRTGARATGDSSDRAMLNQVADKNSGQGLDALLCAQLERDVLAEAEQVVRSRIDAVTWNIYEALRDGASPAVVARRSGKSLAAIYKAKSRTIKSIRGAIGEVSSAGED